MTLATILPGAVFGPILTSSRSGFGRDRGPGWCRARCPAERHGSAWRSSTSATWLTCTSRRWSPPPPPDSGSWRPASSSGCATWPAALRSSLGPAGRRISTRQLPDFAVRFSARFLDHSLRAITPALGRRNRHSTEKAKRVLDWQPRPATETVLDCGRSLIEQGVV